MKKLKSIVFGANGYIGRHLVAKLQQLMEVCSFGLNERAVISGVPYRQLDLRDNLAVMSIDWNVDFVFYFAGLTGTTNGFAKYSDFVQINEICLLNVLNSIKSSSFRPRLIFPSTRLVYKGSEEPLVETAAKEPKTIYAANKLFCEHVLQIYLNVYAIPHMIFRICVPYGDSVGTGYSYGTISSFFLDIARNGKISVYGDGRLRRTFSHIDDIVDQIISTCLSEDSVNRTFNVGGEDYSIKGIAEMIARKKQASVEYVPWPADAIAMESGSTVFNSDHIQKYCDYLVGHRFAEWLEAI